MGNRKEEILIVALHLFARDGYEAVSVSQIAGELELARRGYDVTGIDITSEYIEYATEQAEKEELKAKFLCIS